MNSPVTDSFVEHMPAPLQANGRGQVHRPGRQGVWVPRLESVNYECPQVSVGLPRWLSDKGSTCQFMRLRFDPYVRKIPWRRKWQTMLVFLPGESNRQESGGLQSMGVTKSQTGLCMHAHTKPQSPHL